MVFSSLGDCKLFAVLSCADSNQKCYFDKLKRITNCAGLLTVF